MFITFSFFFFLTVLIIKHSTISAGNIVLITAEQTKEVSFQPVHIGLQERLLTARRCPSSIHQFISFTCLQILFLTFTVNTITEKSHSLIKKNQNKKQSKISQILQTRKNYYCKQYILLQLSRLNLIWQ